MSDYALSNLASADLAHIWLYVANDRPRAADELIDELTQTFAILAKHPGMGEARPRLGKRVRAFTVRGYVVYFRPTKKGLDIMRVVHGARRLKSLYKSD